MGWQPLPLQTTTCPLIKSSVTAGLPKLLSIKRSQNQKMHAWVKPTVQDTEVVLVCKWDSWALTADPKMLRTSKPCWETVLKLTMHAIPPLPAPMNATDGWQWAGAYPYQNLDDTVGVLMQCVKNYMIGNC